MTGPPSMTDKQIQGMWDAAREMREAGIPPWSRLHIMAKIARSVGVANEFDAEMAKVAAVLKREAENG